MDPILYRSVHNRPYTVPFMKKKKPYHTEDTGYRDIFGIPLGALDKAERRRAQYRVILKHTSFLKNTLL